ncbi:MAG: S1-like domain-containing RNA-binding protein [Microscillaceae bacterium]|nr:S1-like domain-containing RNA-binding protein [Microscillaceae bacterium]
MIEIGQFQTLEVLRDTGSGLFLGDTAGNDVLLPGKEIPYGVKVGDKIKVFIYQDKQGRTIASSRSPKITLHRFAFLEVKKVTSVGAFVDWGLDKDLLVPYLEQYAALQEGNFYIFYLYLDAKTNRLVASNRINGFLNNEKLNLIEGQEVELIVWESTDLGYNVIINHQHKGLLYKNEIFKPVQIGQIHQGFIYKIREDNKIDVRLQKTGFDNIEPAAAKILETLRNQGGFLPLYDGSSPEEIRDRLQMSKKTFKKAIGNLYKEQIIKIGEKGIYLLEDDTV